MLVICGYQYYVYVFSKTPEKSLSQMLAHMYNGYGFILLAALLGILSSAFLHQKGDLELVSGLKDKAKIVLSRFAALFVHMFFFELITAGAGIAGCFVIPGVSIAVDEIHYIAFMAIAALLTFLFLCGLFVLISTIFKDELLCDLIAIVVACLPILEILLLNIFGIDITSFTLMSSFYSIGNEVNVYQGLLCGLLGVLYTIACMLIASIIIRRRDLKK
jgi:hypothetical protein